MKIKYYIKKNIYIFLLGTIVFTTIGVFAVITFASSDVSYDNSNSGLTSTNVKDAIDELYKQCKNKTVYYNYNIYSGSQVVYNGTGQIGGIGRGPGYSSLTFAVNDINTNTYIIKRHTTTIKSGTGQIGGLAISEDRRLYYGLNNIKNNTYTIYKESQTYKSGTGQVGGIGIEGNDVYYAINNVNTNKYTIYKNNQSLRSGTGEIGGVDASTGGTLYYALNNTSANNYIVYSGSQIAYKGTGQIGGFELDDFNNAIRGINYKN